MITPRSSLQDIQRIAVFRALQLGDMLCAVPALRALRQAYPAAHITLIGLPWAQSFIDRYPELIDKLMQFPGAVGFPEQAETDAGLPGFFADGRARCFDLAIQLHGSGGVANDIVEALRPRISAGFLKPGETRSDGYFMPWPDDLPESERYNALMRYLGVPVGDAKLQFPLSPQDLDDCTALAHADGIEFDRLVCVHPGARLASRRWPTERFAEVADILAADGWQIAITGSADETAITGAVLGAMQAPALHLVGQTSLGALGALIARAQLLVCNDTGVSHVAAGVGTPSVVIASGSDTRRWAPLDAQRHRVLADHPACRPCAFADCPVAGHPCARNVDSAAVVAVARAQLARFAATTAHGAPFILHERSYGHAA
ncbi:MAG: glycosyltransferase family 9 protein [Janthinobacterium lividum]